MNMNPMRPDDAVLAHPTCEHATPCQHPPLRRSTAAERGLVVLLWFLTAIPAIPALGLLLILLLELSDSPLAPPSLSAMLHPMYLSSPWPILLHAVSGVIFFSSMPWQFLPAFRQHYRRWHRISGYLVIVSVYTMAISGVWLHLVLTPADRGMRFISLLLISMAMLVTLTIALQAVLKRDYAQHQRWMLRAVAISLAVVTPLFLEIIALFGQMLVLAGLGLMQNTVQFVLPSTATIIKPFALSWPPLQAIITALFHDYGRLLGMLTNLWLVHLWLRRASQHRT